MYPFGLDGEFLKDILNDPRMLEIFWSEYGFEEWSGLGYRGGSRRVTFRKSSLMGEVARYYSDDYILRAPDAGAAARHILDNWQPVKDVMSHRILVLGDHGLEKMFQRSFFFGFKGWVEVSGYRPGDPLPNRKFADLCTLANNAGVVLDQILEGINPVKERIIDPGKRGVFAGKGEKGDPSGFIKKLFRR